MKFDPYADHRDGQHYFCFYLNVKQQESLALLHSTGLWGDTMEETVSRILDGGLRALQREIQAAIWNSRPMLSPEPSNLMDDTTEAVQATDDDLPF